MACCRVCSCACVLHPHKTLGTAVSHNGYAGPWKLLSKNAILTNANGSPHECEDPFLWKTARGWHLLAHNFGQEVKGQSAYAHSLDGVHWTLSPKAPFDCTLTYTDGTTDQVQGCGNRPQLAFAHDGKSQPIGLFNGAQTAKPNNGKGEYTLFRPVV